MQVHYSLYVQYDVFLYIEQIDYINISDPFLEGFCVTFKSPCIKMIYKIYT